MLTSRKKSLQKKINERLNADSKKMAKLVAKDLPTEDEWIKIHSKLPKW